MLTPRFAITQTDEFIEIVIHAPYANIKDAEIHIDGADIRFYSTPYYLRLNLPGEVEETDESSGSYNSDKGDFLFTLSKVIKGEHFENLDMITNLLSPPKSKNIVIPNIEVIGNPAANTENINNTNPESNNDDDEWYIEQKIESNKIDELLNGPKYGFANKLCGVLRSFESALLKDVIDLPMPDTTPAHERQQLQQKTELDSFSETHYLADLMEPESIEQYTSFVPEWETLIEQDIVLNGEEIDLLKELPNKEYLLNNQDIRGLLLGIVDILFASCYNHRTTCGENNSESCWTINKLSSTLCWFRTFSDMKEAMKASVRRSLCYPLYRNWDLSMMVLNDVRKVIKLGKKFIIKRFCEIHHLFNESYEPRYILNQLFIKDYLVWLQQIPSSSIESLCTEISNTPNPNKTDMELDLIELEQAAYSVQEDLVYGNSIHEVVDQVDKLAISEQQYKKNPSRFSGSSTSSSDTDSDDTDSETDSSMDSCDSSSVLSNF